jgi:hypothetical protein
MSQWMIITTQEDVIQWFEEVRSTVVNFLSDWVWEPLIKMMDTIRHKERRLAVMGKDSLNSDLEVRIDINSLILNIIEYKTLMKNYLIIII